MESVSLRGAKVTYEELAYQHILKAIVSHQFRPGDRLRPEDLAALMGLSPTPVKQALARLAGEGLVELRSGLGPHVCAPTVSEILDLYDVREMCEVYAIQKGFHRVDSAFLDRLEELFRRHETAVASKGETQESRQEVVESDRDFHLHSVSLWPNPRVQMLYRQLNVHIRAHQLADVPDYSRKEAVEEHRQILEAVRSADMVRAAEAMRRHVAAAKASFLARAQLAGLA